MTDKPDLKTTAGKITDLDNRLSESRQPSGAEGPTDARQRVLDLLDEGSFVETDALARHRSTDFGREHDRPYTDGVVTGYGTIDGRRVCVFSQDASVFEGTLGEVTGEKICKLYDLALKTGVPMVGIHESAGPRVQEGIVSLSMHARIMAAVTRASGLIPQVAVVVGDNEGMAAFAPALADLVIVARGGALHQAAPAVVQEVVGAEMTAEELGGADVLANNGTAHLIAETDAQALDLARSALAYLPVNNRAEAPRLGGSLLAGGLLSLGAGSGVAGSLGLSLLLGHQAREQSVQDVVDDRAQGVGGLRVELVDLVEHLIAGVPGLLASPAEELVSLVLHLFGQLVDVRQFRATLVQLNLGGQTGRVRYLLGAGVRYATNQGDGHGHRRGQREGGATETLGDGIEAEFRHAENYRPLPEEFPSRARTLPNRRRARAFPARRRRALPGALGSLALVRPGY